MAIFKRRADPLSERARALKAAGLDHVQLSFQDSTREMNDFLSHTKTFELKNRVAQIIKDQGWPMVMNVVLHRLNIDHKFSDSQSDPTRVWRRKRRRVCREA